MKTRALLIVALLLFWILLVFSCREARGGDVRWLFQLANTNAVAVRSLKLYPVGGPFTNAAGAIVTRDFLQGATDTNGTITLSNIYGWIYRGEITGPNAVTTNWYNFPVTNGLIYAADWTTNVMATIGQADFLFWAKAILGPGANIFFTTNAGKVLINGNAGSGAASNAVTTVSSNGVAITTSSTNLDFWAGPAVTIQQTNRNGHADVVVSSPNAVTNNDTRSLTFLGQATYGTQAGNQVSIGIGTLAVDTTLTAGLLSVAAEDLTVDGSGNLLSVGNVTAAHLLGDGSGITALNASQLASGLVPAPQLGSGSPNSTTFLRGDRVWAVPPGGGDVGTTANNVLSGSNLFTGLTLHSNNLAIDGAHGLYASNLTANTVVKAGADNKLASIANGGANTVLLGTTPPAFAAVPDGALSANVPLLNANNAFTGSNQFSGLVNFSNTVTMDAGHTLILSNAPANAVMLTANGKQVSGLAGGGANTFLQGTTPPTYTSIPDAALSANVALLNASQSFSGSNTLGRTATLNLLGRVLEDSITLNGTNVVADFGTNQSYFWVITNNSWLTVAGLTNSQVTGRIVTSNDASGGTFSLIVSNVDRFWSSLGPQTNAPVLDQVRGNMNELSFVKDKGQVIGSLRAADSSNLVQVAGAAVANGQVIGWSGGVLTNVAGGSGGTSTFNTNQFSTSQGMTNIIANVPLTNITHYGTDIYPTNAQNTKLDWASTVAPGQGIVTNQSFTFDFLNAPPATGAQGFYSVSNSAGTSITITFANASTNNFSIPDGQKIGTATVAAGAVWSSVWTYNGTLYFIDYSTKVTSGGTVTSVGLTNNAGLTILNSPITTSGNFGIFAPSAIVTNGFTPNMTFAGVLAVTGGRLDLAEAAAPSSPASGTQSAYGDSTSHNLAMKNSSGTVNHMVQSKAFSTHQWLTAIADDGTVSQSQPAFSDITGSVAASQLPVTVVTNNAALSNNRVQLGDGGRGLKDAAASGAVPIDADGSAATSSQVNALFPSPLLTNNMTLTTDLTNLEAVTSLIIPPGSWFTNNVADGASLTAASFQNLTNTGDNFVFADAVTNTINGRFSLPWDWDAGVVRVGIRAFCSGTNASVPAAAPTNVVWSVRAGAIGDGDRENVLTWGTAVLVTNGIPTNSYSSKACITGNLTVGNTPSTSKTILWQISRLGAATGDTLTNSSLAISDVMIYYRRLMPTNFPTASP